MAKRECILAYGDVQIYNEDLETLEPCQWLNDTVIEFVYEYTEKEEECDFIDLVRPAIVYLIANTDCDIKYTKDYVFLPLNDSDGDGGSHWSLLVYSRMENTFMHYDSMNNRNDYVAERAIINLQKNLVCKNPKLKHVNTPQQGNGYDCGVFVLYITHLLADRLREDQEYGGRPDPTLWEIEGSFDQRDIDECRKELFVMISDMAAKYQIK
ncbi:hypothetical protein HK103_006129 [Boothiomyces macroporosus]|uniref:Ubiquitin-like protease family profile domain-containing protein n=1 Tax=Boothiomyces macroporosus TaxID=261099 RepID=A0AAD5UI49_9FUNG|nr:hypothetical protein HK103_006129 [Boothiomyces macroporosus]